MVSNLYRINLQDVFKGLVTAVLAGVGLALIQVLQGVFGAPDLNVFAIDWAILLQKIINAAVVGAEAGFIGYVTKNFLSDDKGKINVPVLGKIG